MRKKKKKKKHLINNYKVNNHNYTNNNNKQTKLNQQKKKHKKDFDFCVWITMPQTQADSLYPIMQIKENILLADPPGSTSLRNATMEDLAQKLREYLTGKTCLIVLEYLTKISIFSF